MPLPGESSALAYVGEHLAHLASAPHTASAIRGGQVAADAALAGFDVTGYARKRNEVAPRERRGASMLSPYIRHGLLRLNDVWADVADGPPRDVAKFRDELMWQEYARHWYSELGSATRVGVRRELATVHDGVVWDRSMRCLDSVLGELEDDGWLVNQTRMWLASHWAVRSNGRWQTGEDMFFRHLLDGSRAANRLGWQWTTGVGSSKPYGFSRWQVNKRAPGMCDTCEHRTACPIEDWPVDPNYESTEPGARPPISSEAAAGPSSTDWFGEPTTVWLTAESLGAGDPALAAHPELPVVFVFDEPLLRRLQLCTKRLVFLVETLAEIADSRSLQLWLGSPRSVIADRRVAVTYAPVPGFRRIIDDVDVACIHPWPWLRRPTGGSVASFSAWRKGLR